MFHRSLFSREIMSERQIQDMDPETRRQLQQELMQPFLGKHDDAKLYFVCIVCGEAETGGSTGE